jgi:hypothetical protein
MTLGTKVQGFTTLNFNKSLGWNIHKTSSTRTIDDWNDGKTRGL